MIYFDNAATTFPKPPSVRHRVVTALTSLGGNPGRSGHDMSMKAAAAIYEVREKAAAMFGARPENVIFTSNCTHSLNLAIKGIAEPYLRSGSDIHVIISDHEHNSVYRPVHELTKRGLTYSIARLNDNDDETVSNIEKLITPKTVAVIMTLGSNVTGRLLPYRKIGAMCRLHNITFIADGAQVCGVLPVSLPDDNINILCMPGHKGLYGITGTGLLMTDGSRPIYHIMEGGTGSTSADPEQTPFLPDELESGTLNTVGIMSVGAGLDFITATGEGRIAAHENMLCRLFINGIRSIPSVTVYRNENAAYLPIVLFNINSMTPEEAAAYLNDKGFALRGGLHCSPLAHKANNTMPEGAVRFSPSYFNTSQEVIKLIRAVKQAT